MLISHPATVAVVRPSAVRPSAVRPSVQTNPRFDHVARSVDVEIWPCVHLQLQQTRSLARSFGCPLLTMRLTSGKTHVGHVADVHTGISIRRAGGLLIDPAHPNDAPERTAIPPHHHIMFELSLSRGGGGDDDLVSLHDFH